jgi:hypothetical protein
MERVLRARRENTRFTAVSSTLSEAADPINLRGCQYRKDLIMAVREQIDDNRMSHYG